MLFNSFTYLVFLPIVVLLYWLLPNYCRKTLLLIASYVFYMNWIPAYGLLILALTLTNYCLGLAIAKFTNKRKAFLIAGLIFNLGCLCFFKYANFLLGSFWFTLRESSQLLQKIVPVTNFDFSSSPALNIILPLGISFFTFEFIHYITDVYRGSAPVKNLRDFALFAAFFPSQIAGPIKRFQDFIHQLHEEPRFKSENFNAGLFLIFQGLFKKIVLGDNMGQVVSYGFTNIPHLGALDAWLAVAGFTFQIFFDFSGYTDVGRGSALLFGYKVPENFNWPFIASNLTDFWRRWHMSLSTWLRDYLFIPLGGSRGGEWQVRRNIMITMTLGGLWHGAAWHYVIWGAFHGIGLVISKDWHDLISKVPALARVRPNFLWHWSGVGVTLLFLFAAGILFRADGIPQALAMAQQLFTTAPGGELTQMFLQSTLPASLLLYGLFLASTSVKNLPLKEKLQMWFNSSIPARIAIYASLSLVILGFAPGKVAPFIYFQF